MVLFKKAKELGGKNSKLVVIVARDSTVRARKRKPVINENKD